MPEQAKHPGTKVIIGGDEYIVPALGVLDFRRNVTTLMSTPDIDPQHPDPAALIKQMDDVIPVLYLAFKRNYPQISQEQFTEMLDLRSYGEVNAAVMAQSGVHRAQPGEV